MAAMAATATQRGKSQSSNLLLHRDFSSPVLKSWGAQRLIRYEGAEKGGEGVNRENIMALPSPARDCSRRFLQIKAPKIGHKDDDGGIAALQEKLMGHLREAADRMKLDVSLIKPASPAAEPELAPSSSAVETSIPWNLRKRRGSPLIEAERNVRARMEIEENKKPKQFSVSISKKEIEEDIFALTGSRPRRRPKKRPRIIQRKLDEIFPGLYLSDITPEMYKVTE